MFCKQYSAPKKIPSIYIIPSRQLHPSDEIVPSPYNEACSCESIAENS